MAERASWEQSLAWALRARADELATAAPTLTDPVSVALLEGLERATARGDWSTVSALGAALNDRKRALAEVTPLDAPGRRKGRSG